MTQPGTLIGRELYLRCPYCGDSQQNLYKAHFTINVSKFIFHCFRCGISGKLSDAQTLSLMTEFHDLNITVRKPNENMKLLPEVLDDILPGAGSPRPSNLDRWHYGDNADDAFLSLSAFGHVVGVQIRPSDKTRIKTYGVSAFGFASESLLSTPSNPLRIVEGAYDVIYPNDVCVFGSISYGKLKSLLGHYIVLCPDGDIWKKPDLFKQFNATVKHLLLNRSGRGSWLVGIEFIADGKDPDEVPKEEREFIPVHRYIKDMVDYHGWD